MSMNLTLATEIACPDLSSEVTGILDTIPGVEHIDWHTGRAETEPRAPQALPCVIVIDDAPRDGTLCERIGRLRGTYPQATVFVVSSTQQPELIVTAMKAGAAEFFVRPLQGRLFQKALDDVHARLAQDGPLATGRVFSFVSAKGGAGTTVLATNTAVTLGLQNKQPVALCDLSCQSGDSTVLLDLQPKTDMADISANFHRLDAALLKDCMARHASGLALLAAPNLPERSEEIRPEHVARIIDLLKQHYATVVIDCASMYVNDCGVASFRQSEKVFIVTELALPALRNAVRLKRLLTELGIRSDKIEYVVNRYHKGGTLSIESAEETLHKRIYWLFPNDYADVIQSINRGTPIVQFLPHSQLATNISAFVERLLNPAAHNGFRGIRGIFGKAV